jgi:hypothetical protein
MSDDIDIEEVTESLTKDVISEIESKSISMSQLSSSNYNWENVNSNVREALDREDDSCVECGRNHNEIDDYDDFFIRFKKSISKFDSIDAAIHPDNLEPICSDCNTSSPDELLVNVTEKTSATERFSSSLSYLEKTFSQYTPSLFVKKYRLKFIIAYIFIGVVYAGINMDSFTSSLIYAYEYPFDLLSYIIREKTFVWFIGILPVISGVYSLFEYYHPKEFFESNYKSARYKLVFIIATILLAGLGVSVFVVEGIYQGTIPLELPSSVTYEQISVYISLSASILSPIVGYMMLNVVDSDKLTVIHRDLQKRGLELAEEKGITKPKSSGGNEPVFTVNLIEETIELMKERNINYYGWSYGSVVWKGLAVYSIGSYISFWVLGFTGILIQNILLYIALFAPALISILYLLYRKYKLEAVKR